MKEDLELNIVEGDTVYDSWNFPDLKGLVKEIHGGVVGVEFEHETYYYLYNQSGSKFKSGIETLSKQPYEIKGVVNIFQEKSNKG